MYSNQGGRILDKENATEPTPNTLATGAHAGLVKQNLSVMNTPSKQQTLKTSLVRTPSQQSKQPSSAANSPFGQSVLRTKTNLQQPPPLVLVNDTSKNPTAVKNQPSLARTFSASQETNTLAPATTSPEDASSTQDRRRSLTKRGTAKSRLHIHKDDHAPPHSPHENNPSKDVQSKTNTIDHNKPTTATTTAPSSKVQELKQTLKANSTLETTTTQLSITRAFESQEKVIVGAAEAQTKRRALTNEEDRLEIEYCPPSVPEQPYDPEFEIDYSVLKTVPPAMAYQLHSLDRFDIPDDPVFDLAPIDRQDKKTEVKTKDELDEDAHKPDDPVFDLAPISRHDKEAEAKTKDGQDEDAHIPDVKVPDIKVTNDQTDVGGSSKNVKTMDDIFGIDDLYDESKIRPPFDGFVFEIS
ncbi:hypothetical protein BGZ94_010125 [Podila epigama]|nr:hypothetical protein BGZ94_010125 [Podila epigama]